ncbi:MAG TPA: hypothetical protein VHM89_01970 [Acidimicrobiales bacterium]|nr:hypothetical protein [Acidimicrobiales bacterium]
MYKPTSKQLAGVILAAVGVAVVLAVSDLGLWLAALVGIVTMVAEYRRVSRTGSARRCGWTRS